MPPLAAAGKATNILHQGFPATSIVRAFSSNSQFRPRPVAVLRQLAHFPFNIFLYYNTPFAHLDRFVEPTPFRDF